MPIVPDYLKMPLPLRNQYACPDRLSNALSHHIADQCLENIKERGKTKSDAVIIQCNALSLDLALCAKMPIHLNATYGPAGAFFYAARDKSRELIDKIYFYQNSNMQKKFEACRQLLIDYESAIISGKTLMEVEMISVAALYTLVAESAKRMDDEVYVGELFNLGKVDMLIGDDVAVKPIIHHYGEKVEQRLKDTTISTLPIEMLIFRTLSELGKENKRGYFVFDFPFLPNAFTVDEFQSFVKDMLTLLVLKGHQPLLYCWNRPENVAFLKACGVNTKEDADGDARVVKGEYYMGRRDRVPLHVGEVQKNEGFILIS